MKKPCKVVGVEMLEGDEEKITFYFTELKSYGDIIISRRWHKSLFNECVDRMKDGLTFDFMDIDLCKDMDKSGATKREVSELKLSKTQSPNIRLKDNSNELSQISSNDETSLNNNIKLNFEVRE